MALSTEFGCRPPPDGHDILGEGLEAATPFLEFGSFFHTPQGLNQLVVSSGSLLPNGLSSLIHRRPVCVVFVTCNCIVFTRSFYNEGNGSPEPTAG